MPNVVEKNPKGEHVIGLLADGGPEGVQDCKRKSPANGEVVASTLDEEGSRHIQVAEMVMEKARRMVEFGEHVDAVGHHVVLLELRVALAVAVVAKLAAVLPPHPEAPRLADGGVKPPLDLGHGSVHFVDLVL